MANPIRKLAAIMFTDIVGFTVLMGDDEKKAMDMLQKNREVQKPLIKKYNGTWLKELGDGTLSSFPSALEALNCAIEIQRLLKWDPKHNLRIGIHVGDVIFEKSDVFGSGVNVASRIEPLAVTGGICVTEAVFDAVRNHAEIETIDLGNRKLKNVDHDIRVYAIKGEGLESPETGDKPSKTSDLDVDEYLSRQKPKPAAWVSKQNYLIVGVLAFIIFVIIFIPRYVSYKQSMPDKPEIDSKSIAVLPFTAFSSEEEDLFFADGVHDDILTQISKIRDLKVISRTSVVRYKETQKSMREIAAELNVANILEGSVRRAGGRIRIVAQLVKADTDEHLWAETYDRDYADIFAIQSDVAQKIASALKATLTPGEKSLIEKKPTDNLKAYDYYLRGNVYLSRGYLEKYLQQAIQYYQKAIDLDHNFTLAYTRLSAAHIRMYWHGFDHTRSRLQMSKSALDRALELDPISPDVHLANGYYYYYGFRDFDNALSEFEIAEKDQPNNSDLLAAMGYVQRRQGKWEQSTRNLRLAAELDLQSALKSAGIAVNYIYLRNWPEARRYAEHAIIVDPENPIGYSYAGLIIILSDGDFERVRQLIEESRGKVDINDLVFERFFTEAMGRDYQKALEILEADTKNWYVEKADLYSLMDQTEIALSYYDSARIQYENAIRENSKFDEAHKYLGLAYAGLGRKEDAIREGKLAVNLVPIAKDALTGPENLQYLAVIYTSVGEHDLALKQIEYLLSIPSYLTIPILKLDPRWDPLRDNPRFQKLVAGE